MRTDDLWRGRAWLLPYLASGLTAVTRAASSKPRTPKPLSPAAGGVGRCARRSLAPLAPRSWSLAQLPGELALQIEWWHALEPP